MKQVNSLPLWLKMGSFAVGLGLLPYRAWYLDFSGLGPGHQSGDDRYHPGHSTVVGFGASAAPLARASAGGLLDLAVGSWHPLGPLVHRQTADHDS